MDKRWSLGTRDPVEASIAAYKFGAKILSMKIDPTKIKGWTLKSNGSEFEMVTEDNDSDRASALLALQEMLSKQVTSNGFQPEQAKKNAPTILLSDAIIKYSAVLNNSDMAEKSKRMALSILNNLQSLLGAKFNMADLNNDVIEDKWLQNRLKKVKESTVQRDLSFIKNFVTWASDRKQGYSPAKLTLSFVAKEKDSHYDYFTKDDLKNIFDNLPSQADTNWKFWIVIIGLYTGARIGEIANLRTEHITVISGFNVMRLVGTKTAYSDRTIPIHTDLIKMGFLEYVETRRKLQKEMLFEIITNGQNGPGSRASKFFTEFKSKINITGESKVFHSFRHTITDLMNQASVNDKAGAQYTGHSGASDVRNSVYGRKPLSVKVLFKEVVLKINWQQYCGWQPDFDLLKNKANILMHESKP